MDICSTADRDWQNLNPAAPLEVRFFRRNRLRMQHQAAAAECGLACVAMLLSFHGKSTDIAALRRQWPITIKGATLANLGEILRDNELSSRPLRLSMDELRRLRVPCILHWRMNHFVVLESVRKKHLVLLDPAIGRKRVPIAEVSSEFTGVALEVWPTASFRTKKPAHRLRLSRFLKNAKGLRRSFLLLLTLSIVLQAMTLLMPLYSQFVIDDIVLAGSTDILLVVAIGFAVLTAYLGVTAAFRSWLVVYLASQLNFSWSSGVFQHLLSLPDAYFESRQVGDIQSRFGSLQAIRDLFTTQIIEAVIDGAMAVTTLIVMLLYSPALASIAVASLILYALVRASLFWPLRAASLESLMRAANRDTYFLETLRAVRTIKNFAGEEARRVGFDHRSADGIVAQADVSKFGIWGTTASQLIFGLQNVLIIWLAAHRILDGVLTVGMMVAFLAFKTQFTTRSASLIDRLYQFRLARIHLDRLEDIVDYPPERVALRTTMLENPTRLEGRIELRNVCYRYGRNEPLILKQTNLTVRAGEHVAIVGRSGVGKTTALKLLAGLATPESGEVLVDRVPLSTIDIADYRRHIGIVMQSDSLLSGTLFDNVTFFASQPDSDRVTHCCQLAGIASDIDAMPMRYLTLVGDMGDALSGGQKQRILLARALYRQPKILFLDEATSHLDSANESHVIRAIKGLDMTRIVVAHRAETIRHADRVIEIGMRA